MRHYSSEQWVEYVRGTAPKHERAKMIKHLETGCKKCGQAVGMWATIQKLARKRPELQPPDSTVRVAKSYFAIYRIGGKQSLVPRLATLVFDSFRHPQLAGVRSLGLLPRHYVYQSGPMLIDVWMESANESAPGALTGQILDHSSLSQAVKDVPVKLRSGSADISVTVTNQFGEFHLEILPTTGPDVHLTIGDDQKIVVLIPLASIEPGQTGGDQ